MSRARRRRVLALVAALAGAVASASGLWWLPRAAPEVVTPSDKAPPEDTGRRELSPEQLPPAVTP